MKTADFDFELPPDLIAQGPLERRDSSRLLVLHREGPLIEHRRFVDLPQFLRAGDVVVMNDSKVMPARLRGVNASTSGKFEMLLLEENAINDWWAMLRPGKRARSGTRILLCDSEGNATNIELTVLEHNEEGHRRLKFMGVQNIRDELSRLGEAPLPPYIKREDRATRAMDLERYQTVYAREAGSVAAPTAGLHMSEELLRTIRSQGVEICFVTLHVGLGTFAPVNSETPATHIMHEERFHLGAEAAQKINQAKSASRRIIAVGTTTVRVLESVAAQKDGALEACSGRTRIFIVPPSPFRVVDALLTNFHLPRSTLLMLVSAFAAPGKTSGVQTMLDAYREAIQEKYRFFSFGDAML
jgi:S-adenosylmethionine:tRNA ribosyltransferase-isomerase